MGLALHIHWMVLAALMQDLTLAALFKLDRFACLQNAVRDMVITFMQNYMINHGFYFSDDVYNKCALAVLGKENLVEAKQNLSRFTEVQSMVMICMCWQLAI